MHPIVFRRLSLALAFFVGLFAASARAQNTGQPVGDVSVPPGLSLAEIREVVVVSFAQRNWTVKEKSDDRVVGYLNHRGIEATLTMTFDTKQVRLFCEGWKVGKDGKRIKPEMPDGWIGNLKKDITKRLTLAAAKK